MGRLFSVCALMAVMLLPAQDMRGAYAQPVFFSMLFPQLIPDGLLGKQAEGAFFL